MVVRHLETENKISVEDESADVASRCPVLVKLMTGCAALHRRASRGRAQQSAFFSQNQKQNSEWHKRPLTHDRNICDLWPSTRHLLLYQEQTQFPKPLAVPWLVGLGHIDLCMLAHDQTDYIRPKLTADNSYFYDNVRVSHQCGWAVICKKAETPALYFCMYLYSINCSIYLMYLYLHLHYEWKDEKHLNTECHPVYIIQLFYGLIIYPHFIVSPSSTWGTPG